VSSNYGNNFGFRRAHEGLTVREGRQKTPVGSAIRQGAFVSIDDANPGRLKVAGAGTPPQAGIAGLLVSEEFDLSIYQGPFLDTFQLGVAKPDRLAAIWSGAGTKFWLRNSAAQPARADGRSIPAVTMFTGTPVQGSYLVWNGTAYAVTAANAGAAPAGAVARITLTNGTDFLEAVLVG
jgi:hypothetical protein